MTRLRKSYADKAGHRRIYHAFESGSLRAVTKALTSHIEAGKASLLKANQHKLSAM